MLTIGADPEVFLRKAGKFVSAYGVVPGTKDSPYVVPMGAVQVDGVALEFNIDPAKDYEQFQKHIDVVFDTLKGMVGDYADICDDASVKIDESIRASTPEEALIMGCNPDFDPYNEEPNSSPDEDVDIRAAGGHIHIGGIFKPEDNDTDRYQKAIRLARLMDKYVGVYSLLWDKDDDRRKIYGKAGACRIKPYGLEYRTLSNKWLFNKAVTRFVFYRTARAVESLHMGEDVKNRMYRDIINCADRNHPFFHRNMIAESVKMMV